MGGAEKAAAELAEALARHGHVVAVITLYVGETEVVEERNGVRVYRLPLDNFYWAFGRADKPNWLYRLAWHIREIWNPVAARRIGRILDAEKPDVVNTHNVCGFSLAAWREIKRRGIRLVHTMHDCYLLCSRSVLFRNGSNCKSRCFDCRLLTVNRKALSRLPDSVVSVSHYTLNEHVARSYYEGVPATVIFNIHRAMPRQETPGDEKKLGDLVFGFIGRLEEEKGIETLLMATHLLQSSDWKLKIAGKGLDVYVQTLSKKYSDPRIEWLGFTDAARFYSSVDVVILPSLLAEALPYVCVESLHAGKSLICVSSGGIPEIARLCNMVEFFPSGDANALAEKMKLALASPQAWRECKAPDASKLRVFQDECIVERYLQEYAPRTTQASRS